MYASAEHMVTLERDTLPSFADIFHSARLCSPQISADLASSW